MLICDIKISLFSPGIGGRATIVQEGQQQDAVHELVQHCSEETEGESE